jgi:hypothetical protein
MLLLLLLLLLLSLLLLLFLQDYGMFGAAMAFNGGGTATVL